MAELTTPPEHYFPGALIPTPIPSGGWHWTADNGFVAFLSAGAGGYPGYDENWNLDVEPGDYGAYGGGLVYRIVGEGKWVDFEATGDGVQRQNPTMRLYRPDAASASGWTPVQSRSSGVLYPPVAIRWLLDEGVTYYLAIQSSDTKYYDGSGPYYEGYSQIFTFDVHYAPPTPWNDRRSDAYDVVIPTGGGTYHAVPVLTAGLGHEYTTGTDDPIAGTLLYYTAWWKYVPTEDTGMVVSWDVIPQGINDYGWFKLKILRLVSGVTLEVLAEVSASPQTVTVPGITAGDTIFFQLGMTAAAAPSGVLNPSIPLAQKYQLSVTGAKSTPVPGSSPDAVHYFPGSLIPTPLPADGLDWQADNTFVGELPVVPFQGSGYDVNWPFGIYNGRDILLYRIVGENKWVDFEITGNGSQRVVQTLYYPTPTGEWLTVTSSSGSAPHEMSETAIRYLLDAGVTYYLTVGSVHDNTAATDYHHYSQVFTLNVHYAPPLPWNDRRNDAYDVIIPAGGGTYHNTPYLYIGFNSEYGTGTDDPAVGAEDQKLHWTSWWKYVPTVDTTMTISWSMNPTAVDWWGLRVYRQDLIGGGTMELLAEAFFSPQTLAPIPIEAHDIIYIQVGSRLLSNNSAPFAQKIQLSITGAKSAVQPSPGGGSTSPDPVTPPYVPPVDVPWTSAPTTGEPLAPDHFSPAALIPAKTESGSATLLDLVRAFSSAVGRAVRITGPASIEMVNPHAPLPAGWTAADAIDLYSSSVRTASAAAGVLSINAGDVTLTGAARLITDDCRLVRSSWRIPDRLPVYGLPPAAVKRVTLTFSPTHAEADVEFHYAAVPIDARRP
jgi:hypothetical protein